ASHDLGIEWRLIVMRIAVAIEIPGRIDERVHRVALAACGPSTFRARNVDKRIDAFEWRSAFARDFHVFREKNREVFLGHGDHTAIPAINNRYGCAPVSLTRDSPVFDAIHD